MSKHSLVLSAALLGGCLTGPAVITGGGETDGDSEAGETGDTAETSAGETSSETTGGETQATSTSTTTVTTNATTDPTGGEDTGTTTTGEPQGCEVSVGATGARRLSYVQLRNTTLDLFDDGVVFDFQSQFQESTVGVFSSGAQPQAYATAAGHIVGDLDFQQLSGCGQDSACGEAYIEGLVPAAFRRAASQPELDGFVSLYGSSTGTVEERISATVAAILSDPRFFEIAATGEPWSEDASITELDADALASKLSYFITNSTPDSILLQAAADGSLLDPEQLSLHASRLMASPGGRRMLADYYEALLQTGSIENDPKDPSYIPPWGESLAASMKTEQALFVGSIFEGPLSDPTLAGLLRSSHTFANAELALVYGDDLQGTPPAGPDFEMVELDSQRRPGILSRTAFLSARSGRDNWDAPPVRAGVVLRGLTCTDVPPPPPNIPPVDADNTADWHEAVEDPACLACHAQLDPFGSALDSYDGIGRWRPEGAPEDTLPLPEGDIAFNNLAELVDGLLETDILSACAVQRHLEFSTRRRVSDDDACTLEQLGVEFAATGGDLQQLFFQIATHPSFRLVRTE